MSELNVIKMENLPNYLNGRFIIRTAMFNTNRHFSKTLHRIEYDKYIIYTAVDNDGLVEKIYVDLKDFKAFTDFRYPIDFHIQYSNDTFGHYSCMRWFSDFFNIPIKKDYWKSVYPIHKIEMIIDKKLKTGSSIFEYEEEIRKCFLASLFYHTNGCYQNDSHYKGIPDSVDFLVGGKAEVFRNGDTFTVSIRTTASRYDTQTLINKISLVRDEVDAKVISVLCKNREFIKLGLEPGYYKADKITLTKDRCLVYVFDLKDRVRELLK